MKKLILATTSILAFSTLSGVNAQAPQTQMQNSPTAAMPLQKATPPAGKAIPQTTQGCAPHHKHRAHHKHHPKHVRSTAAVPAYVAFPPAQGCVPQYYCGEPTCPYVYNEGYFWYPSIQANQLAGYSPYYTNGYYWYPSYMHPNMVYIDGAAPVYVYPYSMQTPRAVVTKAKRHHKVRHHKGKAKAASSPQTSTPAMPLKTAPAPTPAMPLKAAPAPTPAPALK